MDWTRITVDDPIEYQSPLDAEWESRVEAAAHRLAEAIDRQTLDRHTTLNDVSMRFIDESSPFVAEQLRALQSHFQGLADSARAFGAAIGYVDESQSCGEIDYSEVEGTTIDEIQDIIDKWRSKE